VLCEPYYFTTLFVIQFNSIQFYFKNEQTITRASIYVMQSVMMDKKHNMNNNNNKS